MENTISLKDLPIKHKLVLFLILKVGSAKTIYNIGQTTNLLGCHIENLLLILKDLSNLKLIDVLSNTDSPSIYRATDKGKKLIEINEESYKLQVLSFIDKKDLFLKICN